MAFEMAQQLQMQGEEVGLVAILDTIAPSPNRKSAGVEELDDATWLTQIADVIGRLYQKNLSVSYEDLLPLAEDERLDYLLQQLKTVNILPPDAGITQIRGFVQVYKAHSQTFSDYSPIQVHKTRIVLFRASEVSSNEAAIEAYVESLRDTALGWSQFSSEPVEVHTVPGDHLTMMAKPNVQVLAEQLKTSILLGT